MTVNLKSDITETMASTEQSEREHDAFLQALKDPEKRKQIIQLLREGGSLS